MCERERVKLKSLHRWYVMRRLFQPLNINWAPLGVCAYLGVDVCSRQIKTQTKTGFPFDIFQMLLSLLMPPQLLHILFYGIDKIFFNWNHKYIVCLLIFYIFPPSFSSCCARANAASCLVLGTVMLSQSSSSVLRWHAIKAPLCTYCARAYLSGWVQIFDSSINYYILHLHRTPRI